MALLFNSSWNLYINVNLKVIYYDYYSLIQISLIKRRKQVAVQPPNKVVNLKVALTSLIANPAINSCSRVDTLSITSLKIALIVYLLTNQSLTSYPLAGLLIKNSLIKEYYNIYQKPPYIIIIELSQLYITALYYTPNYLP